MNVREFTELLKGCRPIKDKDNNIIVQSILNMSLVCLTTDDEFSLDERFGNPMKALYASNVRYGQLIFKNKTDKEIITPIQMAVMTKQNAQNHGMVKSGYVPANGNATFNDAGCVQGSQPGYIMNTDEFRMIPITMREMLFNVVGHTDGHSNIYPAIKKLGDDTSSNADTYLDRYFNKYDKKLEQFIAHFERPDKLIGIVVLINGEIVAIDKFPSFTYAEQVWDSMIRDCYGSLAIISELKNESSDKLFTKTFDELNKKERQENVVYLIEKALKKAKNGLTDTVQERIRELLDMTFDVKLDTEGNPSVHSSQTPKSYILENEGYIGQAITESEFNHMVSIVKKDTFNPDNIRIANEIRNKARRQSKFTV